MNMSLFFIPPASSHLVRNLWSVADRTVFLHWTHRHYLFPIYCPPHFRSTRTLRLIAFFRNGSAGLEFNSHRWESFLAWMTANREKNVSELSRSLYGIAVLIAYTAWLVSLEWSSLGMMFAVASFFPFYFSVLVSSETNAALVCRS